LPDLVSPPRHESTADLECLFVDARTTPAVEPIKRGTYASRLLANFGDTLEEWGRQGIQFSKFYGARATPSGIRILKSAGFQVLETQDERRRITFELESRASEPIWL
jgi:hypothetical protein